MELLVFVSVAIAIISVFICGFVIRRVKAQINGMLDALEDIKAGNGNRRILSATDEFTASIAYEVNDIVSSYEKELSSFRQAEEVNKQLMTSLSHDVRTPLTTLIGYLDAAHKGIVTGKDKDEYVEIARRKAHDLKEYIDVLFAYMRVLNNLIQNVIVHSHADKINISLSNQDGNMKIVVADNGVGIEKDDLKHIFERLYKCDKGRSEKGSGLGLSIVHQLVEKMNGTITAESTPGNGTMFALYFPLVEDTLLIRFSKCKVNARLRQG